ncbi:MAG: response regulator, partial [Pseudomonadota bacterium]
MSADFAIARDFMADFVQENYRETQVQFSYDPLIYHSIQVNTSVGPKLLILKGKDYSYRKWLRHYIASDKKFILRIKDEQNDEFISSKAFSLDIGSIHPVDGKKWSALEDVGSQTDAITGNNHILIVDSSQTRSQLIKMVVEKMGYQATVFKSGDQAIEPFKLQPVRFRMIIVNHESISSLPGNFVEQVLKIDHAIPVIIGTG